MSGCLYRAYIEHGVNTIQSLYRTQYYTYDKTRIILRFCAGLAMIIFCVSSSFLPLWAKGILLLIGAWLVSVPDFPAQMRADKVLQARKSAKNFPRMNYEFHSDFVKISEQFSSSREGSMNLSYLKLQHLIQDKDFFYLFAARDSVCMIQKSTLEPDEPQNFQEFISAKTGLNWRKNKFFMTMNLDDLRDIFKH